MSRQNSLGGNGGPKDEIGIMALLDWEQAAWRPEYWEAMKIVYGIQSPVDWAVLAQEITSDYEREIAIEQRSNFGNSEKIWHYEGNNTT
jgi:hypothetical protein